MSTLKKLILGVAALAALAVGGSAIAGMLQSQIHGVERFDPWTLAGASLFLTAAGLLATWMPTRRAAHTNPMIALRAE